MTRNFSNSFIFSITFADYSSLRVESSCIYYIQTKVNCRQKVKNCMMERKLAKFFLTNRQFTISQAVMCNSLVHGLVLNEHCLSRAKQRFNISILHHILICTPVTYSMNSLLIYFKFHFLLPTNEYTYLISFPHFEAQNQNRCFLK